MDILRVENCNIEYANGFHAVKNVSLSAASGELVCIVGESGSGKTTLIRAILGLLPVGAKVKSGHIWFKDTDVARLNRIEFNKLRGKDIAMIFQNSGAALDPIRKIESQYIEAIRVHDKKTTKEKCIEIANKMLRMMHLKDPERVLHSYSCQLSGGMNQRVGIAMAMTARPTLLLADEPTSALDVTVQAQVVRQIKELKEQFNATIVMVTHNMGVASYLADKIAVMKNGEMIEWGSRNQVIYEPQSEYTKMLLNAVPKLHDTANKG